MDKGSYGRKDRLIKEKRHDTYQARGKWPEPTTCIECGALFVNGRWSWQRVSKEANETVCPACRRIDDNYPAGYVEIKGTLLMSIGLMKLFPSQALAANGIEFDCACEIAGTAMAVFF